MAIASGSRAFCGSQRSSFDSLLRIDRKDSFGQAVDRQTDRQAGRPLVIVNSWWGGETDFG